MLWCIPVPDFFLSIPYLNFATLFIALCFAFYLSLKDAKVLIVALGTLGFVIGSLLYLDGHNNLLSISVAVFVIAWIGQFIGHKIEGKKPSFFKDIQFLLIGPLWVFLGK